MLFRVFLILASSLFSSVSTYADRTFLKCEDALNIEREVLSGNRSLYYYSAFGSAYGGSALGQLRGYLKIGARLSPRGWDLFQKIQPILQRQFTPHEISRIIVEFLNPETLRSSDRQAELLERCANHQRAAALIKTEIEEILRDIEIYKRHRDRVFDVFERVDKFYRRNRGTPPFVQAKHRLRKIQNLPLIERYRVVYAKFFQEQWNESSTPAHQAKSQEWQEELTDIEKSPLFNSLGEFTVRLLQLQIERKAAGAFYANYGGLFNDRDRSFVWYAAGVDGISRESFESIQEEFAREGITLEFKPRAASRMHWREIISVDRRLEIDELRRDRTTLDVASISGNLLPDDLQRVYVKNAQMLHRVRSIFLEFLGEEGLESSGITFHLRKEQGGIYRHDSNVILSKSIDSGLVPLVRAYEVGARTYFLSETEVDEVSQGTRPLHSYAVLGGKRMGADLLGDLMRSHAQVGSGTFSFQGRVLSGESYGSLDTSPTDLNPVEQFFLEGHREGVLLEFRPEVSRAEIDEILHGGKRFDMRLVSRIFFPNPDSYDEGRSEFFKHFGLHSKFRWGCSFHLLSELRESYTEELREFLRMKDEIEHLIYSVIDTESLPHLGGPLLT